MTSLGTFPEGIILIVLAIACAVIAQLLKIDWLYTVAAGLFTAGLAYITGGGAGKAQMLAKLKRNGYVKPELSLQTTRWLD